MLETIQEYAREKLEESGEAAALRREHALYFMRLAEEAEPHLTEREAAGSGWKGWRRSTITSGAALQWARETANEM